MFTLALGLLSGVFLLSAAAKAGSRRQADFLGVAGAFAPALRAGIVIIEVCLAVEMHISRIRSVSLLASCGLCLGFVGANLMASRRLHGQQCACFGSLWQVSPKQSALRAAAFFLVSAVLLYTLEGRSVHSDLALLVSAAVPVVSTLLWAVPPTFRHVIDSKLLAASFLRWELT